MINAVGHNQRTNNIFCDEFQLKTVNNQSNTLSHNGHYQNEILFYFFKKNVSFFSAGNFIDHFLFNSLAKMFLIYFISFMFYCVLSN